MFFKAIAPTCAKGISFSIKIEAADDGKLAVSVTPISATGKSGFNLTAKQFIATPEEFDNEFSGVMSGFAATQQTLAQQLKAAELVAEEVGKAAVAAAAANPKPATSSASKSQVRPKNTNQAPAGLIDSDGTGDEVQSDDEPGPSVPVAVSTPAVTNGFDFALEM